MHARLGGASDKNNKIIMSMLNQNALTNGKINCEQELNLGLYQNELAKVKEACWDVVGLKAEGVAGYQETLTKDLARLITSHIIYMIEQGIIHPLSIYAGSHIVEKFEASAKLEQDEYLTPEEKEELNNLMDKLDEESNLTENQLRAIKDGYRPVQLGNKLMFFLMRKRNHTPKRKKLSLNLNLKLKIRLKVKQNLNLNLNLAFAQNFSGSSLIFASGQKLRGEFSSAIK